MAPELPAAGAARDVIRRPRRFPAVRRNPVNARHASVAAIGIGSALFVLTSLITPLAGADVAKSKPQHNPNQTSNLEAYVPDLAVTPSPVTAKKVLTRKPTESKNKAPVDHGAISALASNGIPAVALNAYRVAAARMGNVEPSCGIDWSLLAGIGREESDHGRFGGAQLHADGTSTPRIIGPALDGTKWDLIAAPGNGLALDGDAKYAHALGPMQFIPSTWAGYGADATGDGRADIFNINDAALGAARYLCAAGGNLRTEQGQAKAVLAYNHNDQYLAQVLALANAYKHGIPISGIPIGNIKGKLPKVANTGYIPPANPGGPTAADKAKAKAKKSSSASPSRPKSGAPKPARSSSSPGGASTSRTPPKSSPKPSPSPSAATSSKPSPSSTCNMLQVILGCKPS
ncbi:MAG: lytic transglycosylase domain-containing protein [Jatrophihabitans sp.]